MTGRLYRSIALSQLATKGFDQRTDVVHVIRHGRSTEIQLEGVKSLPQSIALSAKQSKVTQFARFIVTQCRQTPLNWQQ